MTGSAGGGFGFLAILILVARLLGFGRGLEFLHAEFGELLLVAQDVGFTFFGVAEHGVIIFTGEGMTRCECPVWSESASKWTDSKASGNERFGL